MALSSPVRISCVVPVRDGERFLAEAIQSALDQSLPPIEILVVNDGSTDGSEAIAAGFGAPVRVLRTAGDGPAVARNLGIAEARGDVVAFLDCDDIWLPHKLETQMMSLASTETACICGVENFWMDEVDAERDQFAETRFAGTMPGYCGSALVVAKALFDRVGVFDPARRHTDLVRWIMGVETRGIAVAVLPDLLVRRRRHGGNMTRVGSAAARLEFLDLIHDKLKSDRGPAHAP